ncbi:MAG: hypothetical protein ACI4DY_01120 [Monoglobaceae bacterium]
MSRMSARFVAIKVGKSTSWVYGMWKDMGLVVKDKFGDWALTEMGRTIGGKMSKSTYRPVPTFEFEKVEKLMIDFYNKYRK